MTAKPPNPDPVESSRRILNMPESKLADLEGAAAALADVRADLDVEIAGMAARRREILASDGSAHEIDKRLEQHDAAVSALVRRDEVAAAIAGKVAERLAAARAEAAEDARRDRYDQARELHVNATNIVRQFLDRIAPEALEVMQVYAAAEAATAAANRDLPACAMRIPTIEQERLGSLPSPRVTVRRFQVFLNGREPVGEVGKVEAHNMNGLWAVHLPSRSVQGDVVIPNCVVVDYVEVTTEKHESRPLESLATALRVPEFGAPPPGLGRPERKTMPLSEWLRLNGEPAEQVPLQVAAE